MADPIVQVAGVCRIFIQPDTAEAATLLGYTRNMAEVTKEAFFVDVPGDENGGDDGPPIDIIYMGEIARIRLELTKWDETEANKVRCRVTGATAGRPGYWSDSPAGTLMFAGSSNCIALYIKGGGTLDDLDAVNTLDRHFPRCVVRNAIEIGRGTKYSTLVVEFEAHRDATGILYDSVITDVPTYP